jgi:hypothetical protein
MSRLPFLGISVLTLTHFLAYPVSSQERPPGAYLEKITFETQGSKPTPRQFYVSGQFATSYNQGVCGINQVRFLYKKYGIGFSTYCKMETGDVVAMLGGVFRAECQSSFAVFHRIADNELPKGAKLPGWDSITIPLSGGAGLMKSTVRPHSITGADSNEPKAELRLTLLPLEPKKFPVTFSATVKPGDILLIRDKGHLVRAIVPPNPKARVVGWVELSPEPFSEADLIRDKKAFVRPIMVDEK